jgi:ribonuclease D
LAVLRELWQWREAEAIDANRPPFFILTHELLVDIAAAAAADWPVEPLVPRHLTPRRREGLARAIKLAREISADKHPELPRRTGSRPTEAERRRYEQLEKRRDTHACELGLDPTLIASRATLGELARNWDKHASELMNWQRELLQP